MGEEPQSEKCERNAGDVCGGLLAARPGLHCEVGESPHGNPPDDNQERKKELHCVSVSGCQSNLGCGGGNDPATGHGGFCGADRFALVEIGP